MADDKPKRHWSIWLGRITLVLGLGAVILGLGGAIGAGQRWWDLRTGLNALTVAFFMSLIGLVLGIIVFALYRRLGQRIMLVTLAGLICSAGYAGYIGYHIGVAMSLPQIHDISTDLENPPQFVALTLRPDNFSDIPGRGEPEYAGMDAMERWRVLHAEAYGDIRTLRFPETGSQQVIVVADRLAKARGWEIANAEPDEGLLEATDTVSLFRFKDDIVVRAQPDASGRGSIVDVRSVSRYGRSDLGVNARRVRKFTADLTAAIKGR